MKSKKDNTIPYILSTISFIIMGIILTGVINTQKGSSDLRTRASATTGVDATGKVVSVDSQTNTITVQNLTFQSSPGKPMGTWTITPPSSFAFSSVIPGNTIAITIDAKSVSIPKKTLTAKEIKKK